MQLTNHIKSCWIIKNISEIHHFGSGYQLMFCDPEMWSWSLKMVLLEKAQGVLLSSFKISQVCNAPPIAKLKLLTHQASSQQVILKWPLHRHVFMQIKKETKTKTWTFWAMMRTEEPLKSGFLCASRCNNYGTGVFQTNLLNCIQRGSRLIGLDSLIGLDWLHVWCKALTIVLSITCSTGVYYTNVQMWLQTGSCVKHVKPTSAK